MKQEGSVEKINQLLEDIQNNLFAKYVFLAKNNY